MAKTKKKYRFYSYSRSYCTDTVIVIVNNKTNFIGRFFIRENETFRGGEMIYRGTFVIENNKLTFRRLNAPNTGLGFAEH